MNGEKVVKIDALLEPLLMEASDQQADEYLSQLITEHAEPVVKGIIRYKLHLSFHRPDQRDEADDIYQEVLVQLLGELQQLRKQPDQHPITDVRGMAAVIAHRTCSRWMRRQYPERHALKNRLQYLLTRQRGMALWQDKNNKLIAGFAVWQEQKKKPADPTQLGRLSEDNALPTHIRLLESGNPQELADAVAAILNHIGGPIEFDELVKALGSVLGIRDQPLESIDEDEAAAFQARSVEPDPAWQVEKRMFLQRLWEELQQLPLNQRSALLLNLKDADGRGCIALFPATQVASLRQLADALEMSADRFAELWNDLPLEDTRVAELLGLTRQQVINARKSGRERLTRRLKGFI